MLIFIKHLMTISFLVQAQNTPEPDDYWWLAFVPLVVTAIIFFVVYWGFRRFLRGDRFIAKLFRISEEEQKAKMLEFQEKSRIAYEEKKQKNLRSNEKH